MMTEAQRAARAALVPYSRLIRDGFSAVNAEPVYEFPAHVYAENTEHRKYNRNAQLGCAA
jgi:hypothetical protein